MRAIAIGCSIFIFGLVCWTDAKAQTQSSRPIFRCQSGGELTFSDRPCDTAAEIHELDANTLNTFEPPPAAKPPPERTRTPTNKQKRTSGSADPNKHKQKCERLTKGLKDIRAKQRTGYKASEGGRLRAREAKLKAQLGRRDAVDISTGYSGRVRAGIISCAHSASVA